MGEGQYGYNEANERRKYLPGERAVIENRRPARADGGERLLRGTSGCTDQRRWLRKAVIDVEHDYVLRVQQTKRC